MRNGWLSGSTVTAVPTRTRRVRVAIELAIWSDDEITERPGVKWISPSQTQSRPHASAASASANASRNAATWSTPRRISSTKIPTCMALLDGVAVAGAASLPVTSTATPGSTAYTDVNTLLEAHARRRRDKVFIASPDQGSHITFGEFEALTRRF